MRSWGGRTPCSRSSTSTCGSSLQNLRTTWMRLMISSSSCSRPDKRLSKRRQRFKAAKKFIIYNTALYCPRSRLWSRVSTRPSFRLRACRPRMWFKCVLCSSRWSATCLLTIIVECCKAGPEGTCTLSRKIWASRCCSKKILQLLKKLVLVQSSGLISPQKIITRTLMTSHQIRPKEEL